MKNTKKEKTNIDKSEELPKTSTQDELREVEIEKNFFIQTKDHDKKRLEKWKIGRKNFP